jgi:hypothetical protein
VADALWAYCVARAGDGLPEGLEGVHPGDPVERVAGGELAALVSRVPLAEFGEEPLRRNLNDLEWLERVARAHEFVLERALEHATVVPLRLCTIFADDTAVRRMLDDERAELAAALDDLAGRQEWSVKLLLDRAAQADATAAASGRDYLMRRRAEREEREAADRAAAELAQDVHARLRECARDAVVNRPQNRDLSGHRGEMLLNGAYLVDAGAVERLRAAVAELQERHAAAGARLELSGPFPPYNFASRHGTRDAARS